VATVRALKLHGGTSKERLHQPDPAAVERGFANLERHMRNIEKFGVPAVVAINRFVSDSEEELQVIRNGCAALGVPVALAEVWEKGGEGGIELAEALLHLLKERKAAFRPLYDVKLPIKDKVALIAREIYGADGVDFTPKAERAARQLAEFGLGETPICMAKTQYSFSDDPNRLGAPSHFRITVRDMYPSAGAGFVVALAGDIMTMPGLGKVPAAERMAVRPDGTIEGLF
jgi:formate--tetrahydrofolate ligase